MNCSDPSVMLENLNELTQERPIRSLKRKRTKKQTDKYQGKSNTNHHFNRNPLINLIFLKPLDQCNPNNAWPLFTCVDFK